MKNHDTYIAAKLRSAIYLCGALMCLGFAFGAFGLLAAFALLGFIAYWENGNARITRAAAEDAAAEEKRDRSKETPESW